MAAQDFEATIRVGNHRDGFYGGMKSKQVPFPSLLRHGLDSRILPDIRPIAAELSQLDIVAMRPLALPKDAD